MSIVASHVIVWSPAALVTAVAMEPWAAWLHDRLWHGPLWSIHRTHHASRGGGLEPNDALALFHAPIAVALILYGCLTPASTGADIAFGVGVGMTLFALAYAVVHDGVVHGRLPVRRLIGSSYVRRVVRAHRAHHRNAFYGAPFGLFLGPWELSRARQRRGLGGATEDARPAPWLTLRGGGLRSEVATKGPTGARGARSGSPQSEST